jgi:hypothetical protein
MRFGSFMGWLRGRPAEEPSPAPAAPPAPPIDPAVVDAARARLRRRAIRMEIGGFAPPEGPAGSWFGRVNLALPGEEWPTTDGQPLHALAQIDLTQLPFRPAGLEDLAMITVFIADDPPYEGEPNGAGWCLRAYPDLSALVPLEQVDTGSEIRAFPMRPEVIEEDYPTWDDAADEDLPEEVAARYHDFFETAEGFKLGGWPFLAQHSIEWDGPTVRPARTRFVFQIDSTDKGNWMWGDSGFGYFGRRTTPGRPDEWVMSWQCY